jgi:NAD-dependent dihydropyrimidine dehydrogenase PreA subunit/flavodoxin
VTRITLLYFSAVGGTRVVAELLRDELARRAAGSLAASRFEHGDIAIDVASIEEEGASRLAEAADFLVFLFPTYYLRPAPPMARFVEGLPRGTATKPCFLVATCELYTENCARSLALSLERRGYGTAGAIAIRAPGSDVTAVMPSWLVPWLYRFGRGLVPRLKLAATRVLDAALSPSPRLAPPAPRWYTPFAQLLQVALLNHFHVVRRWLRVDGDRCTLCGACARDCPVGALKRGETAIEYEASACLLCCRCVHGCPAKAISIGRGMRDNRRIDSALLLKLKNDAKMAMDGGEK